MTERKSYVPPFELGKALEGGCIGKVVESRNNQFAVGDYVLGMNGWREYWISDGSPASGVSKRSKYGPNSILPRNIWDDRTHSLCGSAKSWPTQTK
jgi:NADPH-dependent curcumin reductase CurA